MHVMTAVVAAAALVASGPPNAIETENAQPGAAPSTWLPPAYTATAVEGYASEVSVLPGERVHLHVSTEEEDHYRIDVYRLGWYGGPGARLLTCLPGCGDDKPGHRYGSETHVVSANWPVTDTFTVPDTWTTGYYYALVRVTRGRDAGARGYVPFIVREPPTHHSQILVQAAVNTWQAYNPWGGKSLYGFNSTGLAPSDHVSFDRPLAYSAQGPFDWEYNMVRWLEHEGYDVSYQTDLDTDLHPESLLQHRLVMVIGHDEYWTKRIRDAFDAARDAGTNLAFTNSNDGYWQVRYENGGRMMAAYKHTVPDPEPDPLLRTVQFREIGRPECDLVGVMHTYVRAHETGPVDYTVTDAAAGDPWFVGTGFVPGDPVRDVVSNEWDALAPPPPGGPAACVKPGLTVLFHYEGEPQNADAVRYTAFSGARVFATGAQQWSWGLDTFNLNVHGRTLPPDDRLQRFMRNALDDLTRPAPPTEVTVFQRRGRIKVVVPPPSDARVDGYDILLHAGDGQFAAADAGVRRICASTLDPCRLRKLRPGTYRVAAVALDDWSGSEPTLSRTVVVSGRPRSPSFALTVP